MKAKIRERIETALARPLPRNYRAEIRKRPKQAQPSPGGWGQPRSDGFAPTWRAIFHVAKRNAKNRGIDFRLTRQEFDWMVDQTNRRCELTGIAFDFTPAQLGQRRPFAPSLDRIDSTRGYSIENCRIVCVAVNLAMNVWGEDVLLTIARALCERFPEREVSRAGIEPATP